MLNVVNRVLVGLLGLALLAAGAGVLFGALDLPRRWGVNLPEGWPWPGPGEVLLTEQDRVRWRDEGWWWPALIGLLVVLALLSLWWLLAQLRRPRLAEVLVPVSAEPEDLERPDGDELGALLRAGALEEALAAEAESLAGVERSKVRLWGRRHAPRAWVELSLGAHAEPDETVERLRAGALEHARTSAGLAELPAEVRLGRVRHRAERVT